MADRTPIEWTDATWNPITGCAVVSPGCTNCYAMRLAGTRMKHHPSRVGLTQVSKAGPVWTGEVRFNEEWLTQPLCWSKPRMIFVCAHGDLFAEGVPDEWIDRVFAVMALAPQHTFQVLTKRSERMREYLRDEWFGFRMREVMAKLRPSPIIETLLPLPNVWLGVSVEDQRRADERIPLLLDTPAAVRWISAEPLLSMLDVSRWLKIAWRCSSCGGYFAGRHQQVCPDCGATGGWCGSHTFNGRKAPEHPVVPPQWGIGLDWVVAGGESGPGARLMHPTWVRSLRDQCAAAGVPFHFKQWGEWMPFEGHEDVALGTEFILGDVMLAKVGKKRAGRLLDGVTHDGMPA